MNNTSDSYVLCARGLRKDHGRDASLVRAVDGVDLGVAAGETVAIMGPSGCGKSTLLYLLGGLDRPTSGEIWLAGQNLTPMSERGLARLRRERIGFVFQAFHLMDELTAVENVELPALLDGRAHRPAAGHRAAITAATTTLVLGLALNGVTSHPYQQTRAATNGPDLVAQYGLNLGANGPGSGEVSAAQVQADTRTLTHLSGSPGTPGPTRSLRWSCRPAA